MLWKIFGEDRGNVDYYCGIVEDKPVIAEDCPKDVFERLRKKDEEIFLTYGEHWDANFDPELAEKYHLRTE
jgi:hypothetical protein